MKLKCKDFSIKCYRTGNQLRGYENQVAYKIIYNNEVIHIAYKSVEARKWVSNYVKEQNSK